MWLLSLEDLINRVEGGREGGRARGIVSSSFFCLYRPKGIVGGRVGGRGSSSKQGGTHLSGSQHIASERPHPTPWTLLCFVCFSTPLYISPSLISTKPWIGDPAFCLCVSLIELRRSECVCFVSPPTLRPRPSFPTVAWQRHRVANEMNVIRCEKIRREQE